MPKKMSKREKKERWKAKMERKREHDKASATERQEYQRAIDEFQTGYSDPALIRAAQRTNAQRPFEEGVPGSGKRA